MKFNEIILPSGKKCKIHNEGIIAFSCDGYILAEVRNAHDSYLCRDKVFMVEPVVSGVPHMNLKCYLLGTESLNNYIYEITRSSREESNQKTNQSIMSKIKSIISW